LAVTSPAVGAVEVEHRALGAALERVAVDDDGLTVAALGGHLPGGVLAAARGQLDLAGAVAEEYQRL